MGAEVVKGEGRNETMITKTALATADNSAITVIK